MIDDTGKGRGRVMMAAPVGSRALYRRCVSRPALESSRRKPQGGSRARTPDMQTASMHITHATASNGEIL